MENGDKRKRGGKLPSTFSLFFLPASSLIFLLLCAGERSQRNWTSRTKSNCPFLPFLSFPPSGYTTTPPTANEFAPLTLPSADGTTVLPSQLQSQLHISRSHGNDKAGGQQQSVMEQWQTQTDRSSPRLRLAPVSADRFICL